MYSLRSNSILKSKYSFYNSIRGLLLIILLILSRTSTAYRKSQPSPFLVCFVLVIPKNILAHRDDEKSSFYQHPFKIFKRQAHIASDNHNSQSQHSSSSNSLVAYGASKVMGDCLGREDETLCDPTQGGVCRNQTCISACYGSTRYNPRLQPCVCASEDDSFCYLCCGSSHQVCAPAHEYHIYKPNGEYWERQVCSRCRTHPNGLACDERNARRVCHDGRCVSSICHGKPEGSLCTLDLSRLCVDDECRDPCKEHDPLLRMCDCDQYSEDRCELCCHDRRTKRCENAFQKYKLKNKDGRMILRVGLNCRRGLTCNKYGVCSAKSLKASLTVAILGFIIFRLLS
jgi:hypothetical protein